MDQINEWTRERSDGPNGWTSPHLGEVGDAELGLHDHEVAVQHLVGDGAEGLDNEGADGDVGHEAAIHNIDVHPLGTSLVDGLDLRRLRC